MKILHITPQAPDKMSGGGLVVYQTLESLNRNGYVVDYIGPHIRNQQIKHKYDGVFELEPCANKMKRILSLAKGITNSRYEAWKNLKIDFDSYDYVVMDFTKLDYVINDTRIKIPCIVRVHNIERDYARRDFVNNRRLDKWIIYKFAAKQEKAIIKHAEKLVCLTEYDTNRILQLYKNKDKCKIIPVCVSSQSMEYKCRDNKLHMLITGSMWFGENFKGAMWFLNEVCNKLTIDYIITIAGAKPANELKQYAKEHDFINLVDTPDDMSPYFRNADIVIAPVFNGAGMKVKVAEALSYGKPVIGTSHAFEGYEIEDSVNSFLANNAEEFIGAIMQYYSLDDNKSKEIHQRVKKLFIDNYSFDSSSKIWRNIIEG